MRNKSSRALRMQLRISVLTNSVTNIKCLVVISIIVESNVCCVPAINSNSVFDCDVHSPSF
jgi:hypothetical protein